MFLAQIKKNQLYNIHISALSSLAIFSAKNMEKKIKKTQFELQTRAVHDLNELVCLKTI